MLHFKATFWLIIVLAGAAAGALYESFLEGGGSPARGAVFGICIATLTTMHERGLFLGQIRDSLRGLPAPVSFLAAEAVLLVIVLIAMIAAGSICWIFGLGWETLSQAITPSGSAVAYSLLVCAAFIFVIRMRDLLGAGTFSKLMLGRYHRPVSEERAFLFLDVVGSTAYAETHGDFAAQELLKAVFAAIAEPVRRHRGQVDDYIGDQIIVSWPLERGTENARCVACAFTIRAVLQRDRHLWIQRFGHVPELRAALHGGSVVTAEVGVDRHKIAYFGDVMNATARLEGLCRETGRAVLISGDLLGRLSFLPRYISVEDIGGHHFRGRNEVMKVHSLSEGNYFRRLTTGVRYERMRLLKYKWDYVRALNLIRTMLSVRLCDNV